MSSEDSSVFFRHPARGLRRAELSEFLERITRLAAPGRRVSCLLTDDRELRRLNRKFRNVNHSTDVLSFPSATGGEIAISLERAAAQAAGHGHGLADEVRILILHGVLHLAGMDHENDSGEMAKAETRWRRRLGLPRGLIERAAV